jgi:hypothetical protein
MASTLIDGRSPRSYRLGVFLLTFLSSGCVFCGTPSWARHHKSQSDATSDRCATMSVYMKRRIEQMRQLNATMTKERSQPATVAGLFGLMEGKAYVDPSKAAQMTRLHHEAEDLNAVMHASGCPTVNIDEEALKPPTPTLPSGRKTKQVSDPTIPGRSGR